VQFPSDPRGSYLSLPAETCDAIAQYLPVTFDAKSGFYLWSTQDPAYNDIVKSPAYLSFSFPPAIDSGNLVIKVPYFPCVPFAPSQGGACKLGIVFLQAAFLGRDWNRRYTWLAQAPGPTTSSNVLSLDPSSGCSDPVAVAGTDEDQLPASWMPYWNITALAVKNTLSVGNETTSSNSTTTSRLNPQSGLSIGVKAGIGAAVVIAAIASLQA
jgi:hypothetical protein